MAIGSTFLYTLGPAYFPQIVKQKVVAVCTLALTRCLVDDMYHNSRPLHLSCNQVHLGFFYSCAAIGYRDQFEIRTYSLLFRLTAAMCCNFPVRPAIGYGIAAYFLDVWVERGTQAFAYRSVDGACAPLFLF